MIPRTHWYNIWMPSMTTIKPVAKNRKSRQKILFYLMARLNVVDRGRIPQTTRKPSSQNPSRATNGKEGRWPIPAHAIFPLKHPTSRRRKDLVCYRRWSRAVSHPDIFSTSLTLILSIISLFSVPKRGRGRPPKLKDSESSTKRLTSTSTGRGRPRKVRKVSEPLENSGVQHELSITEQAEDDTTGDTIVSPPEPRTIRRRGRYGSRSSPSSPILDNIDGTTLFEGFVETNSTLEIIQDQATESTPSQVQVLDLEPSTAASVISTPTSGLGRVNVSHLRRENELLRLVGSAGGILNVQTREFYDTHTRLLETLADAGEPTSAPPGTRTDKRTMSSSFSNLEK